MNSVSDRNKSMIFNPLIVVASQLGISHEVANRDNSDQLKKAYQKVSDSGIGSVIVDSVSDDQVEDLKKIGAYAVKTDLEAFSKDHNYRSNSGAERIAATVNRFDRFYTHDIIVAVPDNMAELKSFHMQALMYALATTEVGIATLVSPLSEEEFNNPSIIKVSMNWNNNRVIHPLEGSRVGTLINITRNNNSLELNNCFKWVPIHAWRRGTLDKLIRLPPCDREFEEGTDLVRAHESGMRIDATLVFDDMKVLITPSELIGDEIEG